MNRLILFLVALCLQDYARSAEVKTMRLPDRGYQAQIAVQEDGTAHLVFLKGAPAAADIFYARKSPGQPDFSKPIQVNTQPGAAIAMGSIRGPQIAVGKNGRAHIAWMGSSKVKQATVSGTEVTPMLYARLSDDGSRFEPEINLITWTGGLDGGGSIAADKKGNVYVAWHGSPPNNKQGEQGRSVYMTRSDNEGKTFGKEQKIPSTDGTCACCGMKISADNNGDLYLVYRSAFSKENRPETILVSSDAGKKWATLKREAWDVNGCPMSNASVFTLDDKAFAAWETEGKARWAAITPKKAALSPVRTNESKDKQRFPLAVPNKKGEVLFVWTEGTAWERGGSVAWQLFNEDGKPLSSPVKKPGVPVWGLAAAFPEANGDFVVIF